MRFRAWLVFSVGVAVLQVILGVLSSLQHDAILSELARQRLSVIAQAAATAFKPIVDLGLPISMIRNGDEIVGRAVETDRAIEAVHAVNSSGIVVYSTAPEDRRTLDQVAVKAMELTDGPSWSAETAGEIFSGYNVITRDGDRVGAVVIVYPKEQLNAASALLRRDLLRTGLLVWAVSSLLLWVLLSLLLKGPHDALVAMEALAAGRAQPSGAKPARDVLGRLFWGDLLKGDLDRIGGDLEKARRQYEDAGRDLTLAVAGAPRHPAHDPDGNTPGIEPAPRSLARQIAVRLTPLAALFIIGSALVLGFWTLSRVNKSIEPELSARTSLIGTIVSDDVRRAVDAGVPLDGLVGAEAFFSDMLRQLPEVAYIAVATGRVVLEAGTRIDPYLAPPRERKDVRSHPIIVNGEEIAYVVIDIDPGFIARKFQEVFQDTGVVILAAILAAYEAMVLMTSRSLTGGLEGLQRLAALQAAGDFSRRLASRAIGAVERAGRRLSERAEDLNRRFGEAVRTAAAVPEARLRLDEVGRRYRLDGLRPTPLATSSFVDLRLALFLFGAADELPLSFLPLFTRAAYNPWPHVDTSVLISLPLAGYLLAIVVASPFARALAAWRGRRTLVLVAMVPTAAAHVVMYLADSVPEVILARTVMGFGYAIVTLACQDYALDFSSRQDRDRSLAMFSTVLFSGVFFGTALGGVLADRIGQANVFLLSCGLIVASAALVFLLIEADRRPKDAGRAAVVRPAVLSTLRNAKFAALLFTIVVPTNIVLQGFISYLVALTLDQIGATPADIGRILMIYFLAVAFLGPIGSKASENGIPLGLVILAGAATGAVSMFVVVIWPSQIGMALAVLGCGIGNGWIRGAQVSAALSLAETELLQAGSDAVIGALRMMERLGSIVGLIAVAAVAGAFGYVVAIAVLATVCLAGAILYGLSFALGPARATREVTGT